MGLKLIAENLVIAMAALILSVSARKRKVPAGIVEWLFIIGAFVIISASVIKGCSGIPG